MRSEQDNAALRGLRQSTLSVLDQALAGARDVAIVDAPNQRNVGDSLIWAGELAYLRQLGCRIHHVSDLKGYDASNIRRFLPPGGVVLLHGGGNFGDLWLGHQKLRELVLKELTDYKIVQLPQSIYFRDQRLAAHADEVMSEHPDFLLLLRDSLSIARAEEQLPRLARAFCPDMALGYEPPTEVDAAATNKVLIIARADHEAASGLRSVNSDWASPYRTWSTDWWLHAREPLHWRMARLVATSHSFLVRARRRGRRTLPLAGLLPQIPQAWMRRALTTINATNIDYALDLYSGARGIVVDRLHAHVLAALMGKEHVMLDNSYRKLGGVYDDYTHLFTTARYSTDLEDARDQLRWALEAR